MSRRPEKARAPGRGKRGRHKREASPETARWNAEHLPTARPSWMPELTYRALVSLRQELEQA